MSTIEIDTTEVASITVTFSNGVSETIFPPAIEALAEEQAHRLTIA